MPSKYIFNVIKYGPNNAQTHSATQTATNKNHIDFQIYHIVCASIYYEVDSKKRCLRVTNYNNKIMKPIRLLV